RLDQPFQPYQRCRQTQNCRCDRYHRVARHLCQKLDHLPLLGNLGRSIGVKNAMHGGLTVGPLTQFLGHNLLYGGRGAARWRAERWLMWLHSIGGREAPDWRRGGCVQTGPLLAERIELSLFTLRRSKK